MKKSKMSKPLSCLLAVAVLATMIVALPVSAASLDLKDFSTGKWTGWSQNESGSFGVKEMIRADGENGPVLYLDNAVAQQSFLSYKEFKGLKADTTYRISVKAYGEEVDSTASPLSDKTLGATPGIQLLFSVGDTTYLADRTISKADAGKWLTLDKTFTTASTVTADTATEIKLFTFNMGGSYAFYDLKLIEVKAGNDLLGAIGDPATAVITSTNDLKNYTGTTDGLGAGWATSASGTYTIGTEVIKDADDADVTALALKTGEANGQLFAELQYLDIFKPNTTYTFSAKAKFTGTLLNGGTPTITIGGKSGTFSSDGNWNNVSITFTTGATASKGEYKVGVEASPSGGSWTKNAALYLFDLRIREDAVGMNLFGTDGNGETANINVWTGFFGVAGTSTPDCKREIVSTTLSDGSTGKAIRFANDAAKADGNHGAFHNEYVKALKPNTEYTVEAIVKAKGDITNDFGYEYAYCAIEYNKRTVAGENGSQKITRDGAWHSYTYKFTTAADTTDGNLSVGVGGSGGYACGQFEILIEDINLYEGSEKWAPVNAQSLLDGTANPESYVNHQFNITYASGTTDTVTDMPDASTSYPAEKITVSTTAPKRDGYIFKGWSSEDVEIIDGSFDMPAKDVTLTAVWEKVTDNGGNDDDDDIDTGATSAALPIALAVAAAAACGAVIFTKKRED